MTPRSLIHASKDDEPGDRQSTRLRRAFLRTLLGSGALTATPFTFAGASSSSGAGEQSSSGIDQIARRNTLCSAGNAVGVGLRGEYFAEEDCHGTLLLSRIDSTIDFDASMEWPVPLARTPPRSARWSGWIKPPLAGSYRFHFPAPNGSITVARQLVSGTAAAPNAVVRLEAGRFYPITLSMARFDGAPNQRTRLEWTAPYGGEIRPCRAPSSTCRPPPCRPLPELAPAVHDRCLSL